MANVAFIARLPVSQATGEPTTAGIVSYCCYTRLPAPYATYAVVADETVRDAMAAQDVPYPDMFICDLGSFPPALDSEVELITSFGDSGGVNTLRHAATAAGVKVGVVLNDAGYFDVTTTINQTSSRWIDFAMAAGVTAIRGSTANAADPYIIGKGGQTTQNSGRSYVNLFPGTGSGALAKRNALKGLSNIRCREDFPTAMLSNNEAGVFLLETQASKDAAAAGVCNMLILLPALGQTLYETSNPTNPEAPHPMGFNVQERARVMVVGALVFNCRQRNPYPAEGSFLAFVSSFFYNVGANKLANITSKAGYDATQLELVDCVYQQGASTLNNYHPTLTNDSALPVTAYLNVARLKRDGTADTLSAATAGGNITLLETPDCPIAPLVALEDVKAYVLANAGSRLPGVSVGLQLVLDQIAAQGGSFNLATVGAFFAQNPALTLDAQGYPVTP